MWPADRLRVRKPDQIGQTQLIDIWLIQQRICIHATPAAAATKATAAAATTTTTATTTSVMYIKAYLCDVRIALPNGSGRFPHG